MLDSAHFKGNGAIVTGAGEGIGLAIAEALLARGASVLLNDVDEERAAEAASRLAARGGRCVAAGGDLGDAAVPGALVRQAHAELGRLDLVVANAGVTLFRAFLETGADELERLFRVNVQGTFLLLQAAASSMIEQGVAGRMVVTGSVTGRRGHANLAAYGMTKAALESLVRGAVAELAAHGIGVNAVVPGATVTPRNLAESPSYVEDWSRLTPTGRPGSAADVASAVVFLLSDESRQINGQALVVDGGWSALGSTPLDLSAPRADGK
jgi:3-oxoacyl-[acyl-carrier protein] reductase